jgi:Poly(ADP-ribose) polymerase catalytic domain/WGR domain
MATKLAKDTYPEKASASDFQCFGPPATKDGDFDNSKICDLGCFTQDGKDTNKYYHCAVVQHLKSKKWYAYFEWGRTGAANPSFQFVECANEQDAHWAFASQLHSKNDARGEWITIAGIRTLRARAGKDCYLVRPMATRSTGLPDARSIKINEGARTDRKPDRKSDADPKSTDGRHSSSEKTAAKKSTKKSIKIDEPTRHLLRDLSVATIAYTRGSMADESLPTQSAIDEARAILNEAQKRLTKVGDKVEKQIKDKQLLEMTTLMYGRIPKKKALRAKPEEWILSKDNILVWQNDLDAFESALYATDIDQSDEEVNPLEELNLEMEWIDPKSAVGKSLYLWWPAATANRHSYIKDMKLRNIWRIDRHEDQGKLVEVQKRIAKEKPEIHERPLHQLDKRPDIKKADHKLFSDSNTGLLFHGTRSVNVRGIMKEALRMPKELVGVVITGAMFGPGLYFADDWKKSAGYTSLMNSYWSRGSGAVAGRGAFMFAMDVALGRPFVAPKAHGYVAPPDGHHCVFGKAGDSGVQNNEFIVFDRTQQQIRYLAEFDVA